MPDPLVERFIYWSLVICMGYLAGLYALIFFHLMVASFENLTRKPDAHSEDYEALLYSRFTIPVSVIVPAYNEKAGITSVVRCLLKLDYPEFEVIVVNDGSTDGTMAVLEAEFALEPVEMSYRRLLQTKPVRTIYRSRTDLRLHVIDKQNGGKADALNCGINLARYRYLCCVDGDTMYRPQALLAAMRVVIKDPAKVLGLTSLVAVSRQIDVDERDAEGRATVDRHTWTNLQHLEIIRSFVNNRLAWSRLGCMLCVSGAFAVWRRDVINEAGGFSPNFTCEDIEMTFRVLEKYKREGRAGKILALPDIVGITEGPDNFSALVSQRARWQRVIMETIWHYRRVLLNPRYGLLGLVGAPYIVLSECVAPLMQFLVLVTLVAAIAFRLIDWVQFLAVLGIQVFAIGILSTAGLWMNDWSFHYYRRRDLVRLILIAPLDFFIYRPVLAYAYVKGGVEFLRGDKSWHRFERNRRPTARQA